MCAASQLICVGVINSAYQLQGLVKIKSFTANPIDLCSLPCLSSTGEPINLKFIRSDSHGLLICRIEGILDRTGAEQVLRKKIYIARKDLPDVLEEEEYYVEDLIGLVVMNANTEPVGKIIDVHNFGAGDIIEVKFESNTESELYPFTKEFFPEVNKKFVRFLDEDKQN